MARLMKMSQYLLSAWETGKKKPNEHDLKIVANFLTKYDKELAMGRGKFKKKRFAKEYSLSADATKRNSDFSDHNGKNKRNSCSTPNSNSPKAIDIFSGIGGLSLGFESAGYNVVGHVEIEKGFRDIYEINFPYSLNLGNDVTKISTDQILGWKKRFGEIDALIGGPPCQGFSLAGKRDIGDPRNILYNNFLKIADIVKPKVILMENVRMLLSMKDYTGKSIASNISESFSKIGYTLIYKAINACNYGIPQWRERVFFIGIRKDLNGERLYFPPSTHGKDSNNLFFSPFQTFKDVCGNLESLESGEHSKNDVWHFAIRHPDHIIKMLKNVPEGKSAHDNPDAALRPPSGYNTTYKRLKWDEPSSTISTNFSMISGSRNVHPSNTRSLTIREVLRCQTFPDDFILGGNLGTIRKGIGNSVPPRLAEIFAKYLLSFTKKLSTKSSRKIVEVSCL
jgi:DNA (cytosine-5)-methyltransferase 1